MKASLAVPSPRSALIRVGRTVAGTLAEGPGRRFAVWFQGCSIACPDCCNPHLLSFDGGRAIPVETLADAIARTEGIEGVTFVGGEPFDQAAPAAVLARGFRARKLTLLVFTGYRLDALRRDPRDGVAELLSLTDLLVDGPFVMARRSTGRRWIGSDNQTIHSLTAAYASMRHAWPSGRSVEIRFDGERVVVSGDPQMASGILGPVEGKEA